MSFPGQLDFTFQAPARRIWTVRDLMAAVRTELEREYTDVWVEGEISNFRAAESGHLYFTLKDDGSQIRVVMFRAQARLLRFRPGDGIEVMARGRVTIYEARGELQLSAEYLEPKGAGALQIAFEQLKAKLAAEGLFDSGRKKPIPVLPRRIGIVTSPRGAALQDMLNILRRRHHTVNVLIYPAQVQGEPAASEVAAGIRYFGRLESVDVIVIARGGGSMEDLAAFNDEGLARTVAGSRIPVISAIGHETDFTIVDFVADLRAPTPSAAAELVIRSKEQIEEQVETLHRRMIRSFEYRLLMARQHWSNLARHAAFSSFPTAVARRQQRLDDFSFHLFSSARERLLERRRSFEVAEARLRSQDLRFRLENVRRRLDRQASTLASLFRSFLLRTRARYDRLAGQLQALSPLNILERGYALVFDAQGRLVKSAEQVSVGQQITTQLHRGRIRGTVSETES